MNSIQYVTSVQYENILLSSRYCRILNGGFTYRHRSSRRKRKEETDTKGEWSISFYLNKNSDHKPLTNAQLMKTLDEK